MYITDKYVCIYRDYHTYSYFIDRCLSMFIQVVYQNAQNHPVLPSKQNKDDSSGWASRKKAVFEAHWLIDT